MVEPNKNVVKDEIVTAINNGLGSDTSLTSKLQTVAATFKDIQKVILDGVNDPQIIVKDQKDAVEALLKQLQQAIDEEN